MASTTLTETTQVSQSEILSVAGIQDTAATPRNVNTELSYYTPPPNGGPQPPVYLKDASSRAKTKPHFQPVMVFDVRGSGVEHTLDKTGIQYTNHKSGLSVDDFDDEEKVKAAYYQEVEELLKTLTGASKVKIFNHIVRKAHTHYLYLKDDGSKEGDVSTEDEPSKEVAPKTEGTSQVETNAPKPQADLNKALAIPAELQGPVRGIHIDQSYTYAPEVVKSNFPDPIEQERLLKGRFQIINVWRPIKTVFKDPLAVLEAGTVLEEELVPIKIIYPTFQFESASVKALEGREDGGHRWWYMSHQTPEEVLCFKNFDSKTDGRARRVPHSSFTDPEYEDRDARMSVEIRALVFHEDDVE
ncbi:hypothetical protein L207DRAFT_638117 [Hyaloscypha variabilis F]|uniref:7alpha-cephem-methoxylase P8 chain related protein n=1 Tax=Hyaloscypha variabilis (strain UAMH 11265 / GT02V1 / F) TaxID=1149755 RepID=A0A2J6R7T4_HYAVF|nr:hypothetical protein L207DRAFT_638117 [Hyaloscypha variabilis F]